MNSREFIYDAWAPGHSPWAPWAKPVLFATLPVPAAGPEVLEPVATDWAPAAHGSTALVINLPGKAGVSAALALAARGFRPVPLYNAVPASRSGPSVVDVLVIAQALQAGADRLAALSLPANAPPAFMLDHDRAGTGTAPPPNWFDNRSVSFTTDFPSGPLLRAKGIRRVVVVQPDQVIDRDLAHTLCRWQASGLELELAVPRPEGTRCEPLRVSKPGWFGLAFQRVIIALGLRSHPAGGFGGWVPEPSSGSG